MRLRSYQQECHGNIIEALSNGKRSTLAVMPTGCGKTVVFGHVAKSWEGRGRVLVIAHREELIFQAQDKVGRVTGEKPDIEMGDFWAQRHGLLSGSNVVISTVQTQNAGKKCSYCGGEGGIDGEKCNQCVDGQMRRMMRFDPDEFGLLIIDEAHHAVATGYQRVIDYYSRNPNLRVLGVTATPDRKDEAALGQVFDSVAFEYGVLDAINDGWLVPIMQQWVVCEDLDFSKIKTTAGDLNIGELEDVLTAEKALHQVTSPTIEIAGDRATLVFAASVAHAELMAEIFNRHKPNSAICIHGGTDGELRRQLLKEYSQGKYQFLCGCGVFLEGFDEPRIDCIAMARPTKSRALYAQAIGRGTRPIVPPMEETPELRRAGIAASRKPELLVLDFVGNSGRHKLISTADILGGKYPDEVVDRAIANAKKDAEAEEKQGGRQKPVDMLEKLADAQKQLDEERRKHIVAKSRHSVTVVSPFDVFDLKPQREPGWHQGRKPSDKMIAVLENAGIDWKKNTYTENKQLITEIFRRRSDGLCTYKQAKILQKYGQPTNVGFKEASSIIDAIAKNGWQPIERVSV